MQKFWDRREAGRELATRLISYLDNQGPAFALSTLLGATARQGGVVVALPRGGVIVGDVVARALKWPMEVLVVRKLGAPYNPEYGMGAIAEGGVVVYANGREELEEVRQREIEELKRRVGVYRGGKGLSNLRGKVVVIVDDGLATGITMRAAIESVKKLLPKRIIVAVPVGAKDTIDELRIRNQELRIICVKEVDYLGAIGAFYENFEQVTDEEVVGILNDYQ